MSLSAKLSEDPEHQADPPIVEDLTDVDTRSLVRRLRRPDDSLCRMPESELWRTYLELSARGEARATSMFLRSLKGLHRRRAVGAADLSRVDPDPAEHRLVENLYVGELWKAYKRCISQRRIGPASTLLRDLEQQLVD